MTALLVRGCHLCPLSIEKALPTDLVFKADTIHLKVLCDLPKIACTVHTGNSFSLFVWRFNLNNLQRISYGLMCICILFNDTITNSDWTNSYDWIIMNWKRCGRRQPRPNLRYYS
jgi:hypothetical protein